MAFHQQAADELGGDDLGGAGDEALGRDWKRWQVLGVALGRSACRGGGRVTIDYYLPLFAMSEEKLSALLAKLKDDAGLQEKLKGVADFDAALAIAKEAGFDMGNEDWLKYQEKPTLVLSDEELEGVAGGYSNSGCQTTPMCPPSQ